MWRVNITCDDQAWKLSGVEFKKIAENYKGELIGSKKITSLGDGSDKFVN